MTEQRNKSVINDAEDELLNTMKTKLDHLDFDREVDEPWTIHRVLHSIRNEHAGKKTLEPMEYLKGRFLQDLLHQCRQHDRDMLENYQRIRLGAWLQDLSFGFYFPSSTVDSRSSV